MSEAAHATANSPQTSAPGMRGEIGQKWPKFDAAEIAALKSKDDLVTGVQSEYPLDKTRPRGTSTPSPRAGSFKSWPDLAIRRCPQLTLRAAVVLIGTCC